MTTRAVEVFGMMGVAHDWNVQRALLSVLVAPRARGVHRAGAPGALAGATPFRPELTVLDTRNVAQSGEHGY